MRTAVRTVQTSLRALRRNIVRSLLTCIGIVIGIAAVIAVVEIGNGVSTLNRRAIASLGANNLIIFPGQAASGGVSWGQGSVMTLTPEDCEAIIRECPAVRAAAPEVRSGGQVIYGNKNWVPMQITGTTADWLEVRQWPVDEGSAFTEQDVRNSGKVCLIGQTIKRELFGDEDPLGKELRLANVNLKVVGVLSKKGANMFGGDQDDLLVAPWTTIKYRVSGKSGGGSSGGSSSASSGGSSSGGVNTLNNLYPNSSVQLYPKQSETQAANYPQPVRFANVNSITTAAASSEEVPLAIKQITTVLRERHRLRDGDPDDFQIRDMTEMMNVMSSTTTLIGTLMLVVAAISLIVGGVGIMNIMLVSVTERTREIGLRMAVGAHGKHILFQFLVEAIVLCLAGGIIGITLGRGLSLLVKQVLKWPTAVSSPAIVGSVVVSATVGIIFGFYPAWKASRLDPIEALRYEYMTHMTNTVRRALTWSAAVAVSASLAGCMVGPNYHRPAAPIPAGYYGATTRPATSQPISITNESAPDVARWWVQFDDPTLNTLIERAANGNLDLKQAASRVREARAARGVSASQLWPRVDATGSYSRGAAGHASAGDLFRAGLDASWEIDVFGGVRRSVEAADADIDFAVEDRRDVMVTLFSEVALNYLDLRGFQRQIEIARGNIDLQRRSAGLTERLFQAGINSRLDVVNATAQVASTEAAIPLLESNINQAIYALSVLLGEPPATLLDELSRVAPIPVVPPAVPVGLPSDLLERRPDIRRADANLHAATARVGVATADLFPRFTLNGSLSYGANRFGNLFDVASRSWSIGPAISYPLFNAGQLRSQLNIQTARQEQALLNYQSVVLNALRDVEGALIAYTKEQEHRAILLTAVTANRQAVELSTQLYTQGQTDFLNVLAAQRSLLSSEDALVQSDRVLAQNLIAVYKALGGGWEFELARSDQPTTQPAQ
jgi:NodT family efflux transporter outer membrane factor (OMF) lipoprotein